MQYAGQIKSGVEWIGGDLFHPAFRLQGELDEVASSKIHFDANRVVKIDQLTEQIIAPEQILLFPL